jgi:DNA-directed RNA polymerase subunit beta'
MLNDEKKQDSAIILMKKSGARGNDDQITQSLGMRGLMARSYNYSMNANKGVVKDTIEIPVIHSFVEGLTASEYFSSSYGARKSMVDTALKTSKSGYITRKLVDSCQDVIVVENDCGSHKGIVVHALTNADGQVIESLSDRIIGRYTAKAVESIVGKDELITAKIAEKIEKAGIKEVEIRSPITCQCKNGVCAKCYGIDLATNEEVKIGTTVGVIAGQSMGEPVTQLNLRSKATGGAATGVQLSQGYERVKQILDVVKIKENEKSLIAKKAGVVQEITNVFSEDRKEITNVNIVVDSEVYSV